MDQPCQNICSPPDLASRAEIGQTSPLPSIVSVSSKCFPLLQAPGNRTLALIRRLRLLRPSMTSSQAILCRRHAIAVCYNALPPPAHSRRDSRRDHAVEFSQKSKQTIIEFAVGIPTTTKTTTTNMNLFDEVAGGVLHAGAQNSVRMVVADVVYAHQECLVHCSCPWRHSWHSIQ